MNITGKPPYKQLALLVIDCSTSIAQVVVWHGEHYTGLQLTGAKHGDTLLDSVHTLLLEHQLTLAKLDAIAVVNGPGSLTGIRLACSVGQALAYAHNLPIIKLNALLVLVWDKLMIEDGIIMLDARMQRVFWTLFNCGNWQRAEMTARQIHLTKLPDYMARYYGKLPIHYCGKPDTLEQIGNISEITPVQPDLDKLAHYAKHKLLAGASLPVGSLLPNYLGEWSSS